MSAATQQRLTILLDTRVPLEAMLLNRCQRLPPSRRRDWLRNLLLTGFRGECQAIKFQYSPTALADDDRGFGRPASGWRGWTSGYGTACSPQTAASQIVVSKNCVNQSSAGQSVVGQNIALCAAEPDSSHPVQTAIQNAIQKSTPTTTRTPTHKPLAHLQHVMGQ